MTCTCIHLNKISEFNHFVFQNGIILREMMKKMQYLPDDLVMKIQLSLPVKSIVRFKCVSKSWYARFQNSDFIKSHFLQQKAIDGDEFEKSIILLVRHCGSRCRFNIMTKIEECNSTPIAEENIRISCETEEDYWAIAGQCMGVICLRCKQNVFLWNPATREFNLLPQGCRPESLIFYSRVGFGYDHKTNDFKVVRCNSEKGKDRPFIEVYSLNHNKWREISSEKYGWPDNDFIFVNGVCHSRVSYFGQPFMLSFDMTNETWITTPINIDDYWYLVRCGESLRMVVYVEEEKRLDIWKLKDLDDTTSWVKQQVSVEDRLDLYTIRGFWKNSQIFVSRRHINGDNELILYNPCLKTSLMYSRYQRHQHSSHSVIIQDCLVYVESLH